MDIRKYRFDENIDSPKDSYEDSHAYTDTSSHKNIFIYDLYFSSRVYILCDTKTLKKKGV